MSWVPMLWLVMSAGVLTGCKSGTAPTLPQQPIGDALAKAESTREGAVTLIDAGQIQLAREWIVKLGEHIAEAGRLLALERRNADQVYQQAITERNEAAARADAAEATWGYRIGAFLKRFAVWVALYILAAFGLRALGLVVTGPAGAAFAWIGNGMTWVLSGGVGAVMHILNELFWRRKVPAAVDGVSK